MTYQGQTQELSCMKLYIGKRIYHVLVDKIKLVTAEPAIVPVPESPPEILGVSVYEGELVPYFDLSKGTAGSFDDENAQQLGVIVSVHDGSLMGILANDISGQIKLEEESLAGQLDKEYLRILGGGDS